MCIRLKKLRSHKHLGLLFCLAMSALAASYGGQSRSMSPTADTAGVVQTVNTNTSDAQPIAIAMATHD